jgi:Anti-sigma regulatory factor (Ser/Thr protein kinase)
MADFEDFTLGSIGGDDSGEIDYTISDDGNAITIDAVDGAMDPVQDFIEEKLLKFGCPKKPLFQIRLAVEEIFVNIISYAYRPDIGKAEIRCEVSEDPMTVTIQFTDSGKPFDPLAAEEADTSGAMFIEKPGGFGIHLVKNTMDDVEYEYKEGKNILKIKKNLS